jgi:hypothetical protein
MTCSLCENRKAKRPCPALRQEICSQCCGEAREETLDCPLDCAYLLESRDRERRPEVDPAGFPYQDIRISQNFLRANEDLLNAAAQSVLTAAFQAPGAVDQDVREALDALVRTYKTLESGVYYQTVPASPIAAALAGGIQQMLQQFRQQETQRTGVTRTRDADVLGVLIFLLRMALDETNGRRLCKRFLHKLYLHFAPEQTGTPSPLIVSP